MPEKDEPSGASLVPAASQTWAAMADKALTVAAASPDMREAGASLARTTRTIAQTIEVCLKPLTAVHYAYVKGRAYFEEKFQPRLEERTKDIPASSVQDPPPAVAAQVLQNLAFAHDEPSLEDMYLELLATSMDGRLAKDSAHPAFVEVVRQLTALEATLLRDVFLKVDRLSVVELRKNFNAVNSAEFGSHERMARYVFNLRSTDSPQAEIDGLGAMVDNWIRLGLATVSFETKFISPNAYAWAENRPETTRARAGCSSADETIQIMPGVFEPTEFGQRFALAVGIRPKKNVIA